MDTIEEKESRKASPLPFFVVINNTPFDARDPYIAVDDASLSTVMLSISFGLIRLRKLPLLPLIPPVSKGTPSNTIKGSLLALKEAPPRIRIVLPEEGEPLLDITCTPAVFPLISCSGEPTSPLLKSLLPTVLTAPVRSFFVVLP
ncbi:hypothetical protein D3C73_704270 [compost metagenome]